MQASRYVRLPLSFDVERMQQELNQFDSTAWLAHFNTQAYESSWSCLPLRSVGGAVSSIIPVEQADFEDTAHLHACPYLRAVIDSFACEKMSVRLMALASGGIIKEHRDAKTSLEDGVTRLHIPIQTTPDVLFRIDGENVHFSAGGAWYLNASCLHGVVNPGAQARVHLMMDCVSNAWLEDLFRQSGWVARSAHRYPDPSIHDGNVAQVIAQLRATGNIGGLHMAAQLERLARQPGA